MPVSARPPRAGRLARPPRPANVALRVSDLEKSRQALADATSRKKSRQCGRSRHNLRLKCAIFLARAQHNAAIDSRARLKHGGGWVGERVGPERGTQCVHQTRAFIESSKTALELPALFVHFTYPSPNRHTCRPISRPEGTPP